jgi:arginase family enzyme
MGERRALIPYHFGTRWDVIPNREGAWDVIEGGTLADKLKRVVGRRLVVSGDCMAAIPAHRAHLGLVWYDAHGDFHTLGTTTTGSTGGMPLAMLCGLGDYSLLRACGVSPASSVVFHVGGSEFDPGERERMIGEGVHVTRRVGRWEHGPRVHLHVDTDVVRTADLPSSLHPAPNGLPADEFWRDMDVLMPHTEVLSVKTYDPRLDHDGRGEALVLELIRRFNDAR